MDDAIERRHITRPAPSGLRLTGVAIETFAL